ncbi:response regulator [Pedobacter polaris]|uniref:Response regulator n=1 Tax=Pedobacter polaris TaxID=2571273 RepID=A0A4U1CMY5_9SPHI|nr:response regulator [Pedobacter polaris]TKC06693.1 response regulator [Pedobacter polaris]
MKKILIMDNDPDNADAIKEVLDFEDMKALAVYKIEQLDQKIIAYAPDLLIMSIPLKNSDGSALCFRLKNSPDHSDIKIILISTQYNILSDEKLIGCFDDFLEKPFATEELIEKVKSCLQQDRVI